jgi:hypothetical protein
VTPLRRALTLCAALAACAPPAYVVTTTAGAAPAPAAGASTSASPAPPAPPAPPVFAVGASSQSIYGLTVTRCGGAPVWEIGTGGGDASKPTSITYGRAPDGFVTRTGPLPLTAGCYEVFASGGGVGRFTIRADGSLAP